MKENPQWYTDHQWDLWEIHFEKVIQDAYENPTIKVPLPVQGTFVICEAQEISEKLK